MAAAEKRHMLANTYGVAMPARMDIEAQYLAKHRRLPGLPSSRFGSEIMSGDVDRFGFESYLDNPADRAEMPRAGQDLHSVMEARLGLNALPGRTRLSRHTLTGTAACGGRLRSTRAACQGCGPGGSGVAGCPE